MVSLIEHLLNLIYPHLCLGCKRALVKNESFLCTACEYELPKNHFHHQKDNPVAQLFWGRVMLEQATAMYQYRKDSSVQKIIHHIKYKGQKKLGVQMGQYLGNALASTPFSEAELIVPIPLHKKKILKRGFNQSELIARGLSLSLHIPVNTNCVVRKVHSSTQTRKSRYDRWKNVEKIFSITHPELLANKHILLVDDVVTTGATVESCAAEILNIPGTKVSMAALAVAVNN